MARSPNVRERAACQGPRTAWQNKNTLLTAHARASRITPARPRHNPPNCKRAWSASPSATPRPRTATTAPASPPSPTWPTTNSPSPTSSHPTPTNPTHAYPPTTSPVSARTVPGTGTAATSSPNSRMHGDVALAKCRDAEGRDADGNYGDHGLTPAMRRIEAQLDHGQLAPRHREVCPQGSRSLQREARRPDSRHPDKSAEELAASIHDGVRYTFVSDTDHYAENFWDTSTRLEDSGFELRVRTNTWGSDEYKGVNTRWRDPDSGLLFEVQVHTHESLDAKERTHKVYEKLSDARTPVREVESLREYQREVSTRIPLPHGWEGIPDYRKEDS